MIIRPSFTLGGTGGSIAYNVEEFQENTWQNLTNISNNFNYDEDIIALYGIFGNKIGKWSYQLGLRAEY